MQLVPQQQVLLAQQPFLLEQGLELLLELALINPREFADQRLQLANQLAGVGQPPLDRLQLPLVPFGLIAHGMAGGPSSKGDTAAAWQPWPSRRKRGPARSGHQFQQPHLAARQGTVLDPLKARLARQGFLLGAGGEAGQALL